MNDKRITIAQVNSALQQLNNALLGDGINVGFIQETKERLRSIEERLSKEVSPVSDTELLKDRITSLEDKIEHLKDAHAIAVEELKTRVWKATTVVAFIMGSLGFSLGSWMF